MAVIDPKTGKVTGSYGAGFDGGAPPVASAAGGAPEGVPQAYWNQYIQDELAQSDKFFSTRQDKSQSPEQYRQQQLDRWLRSPDFTEQAKTRYSQLSPDQRAGYDSAQQDGNPFKPGAAEFENWQAEAKGQKQADLTEQTFENWFGTDKVKLDAAISAASSGDQRALEDLKAVLASIKDPQMAEYAGDYVSQATNAAPDQRDVANQYKSLDKLWDQTGTQITAEEKLMMELSRRQTEADLKGQRGAIANSLQARGVYGSGAEITQNAMAQQEAANRQAIEMLGAQSNAQKRAMDALGKHGELAAGMRGASANESQFRGTAADRATEFNKTLSEGYAKWKTEQEAANNKTKIDVARTVADATSKVGQTAADNIKDSAGLGLQAASGKTGQGLGSAGLSTDLDKISGDLAVMKEGQRRILQA